MNRDSAVLASWQRQFFGGSLEAVVPFYARKQLLLSAHLSHRNSVRPSVRHTGGSVKTVQARITKSLPSAAWKTLVSGIIKLFYKLEGGHSERGR